MGDLTEDEFNERIAEIGKKIREATGLSMEESEDAAMSVVGCCVETDEQGLVIVRTEAGDEVTRLPLEIVLGSGHDRP